LQELGNKISSLPVHKKRPTSKAKGCNPKGDNCSAHTNGHSFFLSLYCKVNSFHNMQPTFPISLIHIKIARHTRARKFNQTTVSIYYTINAECEAFPKTAVKVVRGSPASTLKNMPLSVPCVEDESISSSKRPNIRFAKQTCSKTIWYLFRGGYGGGFTHKPTAK
jgi:hypothetical protein